MSRKLAVLTEEQIAEVSALGMTLTLKQIGDRFGISGRTFERILEREPEIKRLYLKGKADAINMIAKNLFKTALDGSLPAQMFYLKTRAGWRETNVTEIKTDEKAVLNVFTVDKKPSKK